MPPTIKPLRKRTNACPRASVDQKCAPPHRGAAPCRGEKLPWAEKARTDFLIRPPEQAWSMAEVEPLIPANNSQPVDCSNCGEGQLHYSYLRPRFGSMARFGFYCTTCAYTVADPVA